MNVPRPYISPSPHFVLSQRAPYLKCCSCLLAATTLPASLSPPPKWLFRMQIYWRAVLKTILILSLRLVTGPGMCTTTRQRNLFRDVHSWAPPPPELVVQSGKEAQKSSFLIQTQEILLQLVLSWILEKYQPKAWAGHEPCLPSLPPKLNFP